LKADYQVYDEKNSQVAFLIDGVHQDVEFGSIVNVKKDFLVKENKLFRINVIGYTNRKKIETGIAIKKSQIGKKFSIDKRGYIYRVEYYANDKFAGMVLVKFKS
jgi:hypothetical protein